VLRMLLKPFHHLKTNPMKLKRKDLKFKTQNIHYTVKRPARAVMIEFLEDLTKDEQDWLGDYMLRYEREKQEAIKRLAELEDVKIVNSHRAAQPVGIILPPEDADYVEQELKTISSQ